MSNDSLVDVEFFIKQSLVEAKKRSVKDDFDEDEDEIFRKRASDAEEQRVVNVIASEFGVNANAISGIINKSQDKLKFLYKLSNQDFRSIISSVVPKYFLRHRLDDQDRLEAALAALIPQRVKQYKKFVYEYISYLKSINYVESDEFAAKLMNFPKDDLEKISDADFDHMKLNWQFVLLSDSFWEWTWRTHGDKWERLGTEIDVEYLKKHRDVLVELTSFRKFLQKFFSKEAERRGKTYGVYIPDKYKKVDDDLL